jgi:tRNA threonylcarbamoyladenosine biosynthesis protein TsaB
MLTLAVDTTAEFGSIALADSEGVREEVLLHEPKGFSGALFLQIDALLKRQQIALSEIELFAGASGPGSFTGVRIGLAAIKGLAEVLGRPAAGISNLEALAEFGESELRAPVIDARRGEIYGAVFDGDGTVVVPETVAPFPKFLEMAPDRRFEWIASDFELFRPALRGTRFEDYPVTAAPRGLAAAVARIAMRRGGAYPAAIEANYVRRSDAELLWKVS